MDFCPVCGEEKKRLMTGNGLWKGLHKKRLGTFRYQCYTCGYTLIIKPIKHIDPKELQ